jgi:uncharacterized protein YbcC (UPF0753/DUF2309 family)
MDIPESIREKARDFDEKALEDYILKVNKLLEGMQPGDSFKIKDIAKSQTIELMVEVIKYYMDQHREDYQDGLSFANGYNELRKYDLAFIKGTREKRKNSITNNSCV